MKKASGVRYGILGTPVTQMTFLLLGALMKTVKAEEPEKSESVNLGQKLGNLSAGEKTFAVLGVLSLICLFVAMVTSLSKGGDSRNPHMHKIAATYVFSCFGYLLLVAFIVYGCYLYHSDGSVSTCQNGCLCFGILLFLSCLVLFALKIFKQTQTAAETALISDYVFIFLSVIFLIAFTLAACRQCYFKLPFETITSNGTLLKLADSTQTFICLALAFTAAMLSLSCYMGLFGHHFTVIEIALGILGVTIVLCFVAVLLHGVAQNADETDLNAIFAVIFVLLIPFIYCLYRSHLLDLLAEAIRRRFKRSTTADKTNSNNLVGNQ